MTKLQEATSLRESGYKTQQITGNIFYSTTMGSPDVYAENCLTWHYIPSNRRKPISTADVRSLDID
jgi:hypothetical protein